MYANTEREESNFFSQQARECPFVIIPEIRHLLGFPSLAIGTCLISGRIFRIANKSSVPARGSAGIPVLVEKREVDGIKARRGTLGLDRRWRPVRTFETASAISLAIALPPISRADDGNEPVVAF